jgi:hypothetical protein
MPDDPKDTLEFTIRAAFVSCPKEDGPDWSRCGSGVCDTIHPGGIRRAGFASGKVLAKRCVKLGQGS